MVGGAKEMSRFYKNNKGKTLLNKVSVLDITYSIMVYESSFDVWMEDIKKAEMCATKEEERHSNMLPKTSIMCNGELACQCSIVMVGQVTVAHILIPFVVKFRI